MAVDVADRRFRYDVELARLIERVERLEATEELEEQVAQRPTLTIVTPT